MTAPIDWRAVDRALARRRQRTAAPPPTEPEEQEPSWWDRRKAEFEAGRELGDISGENIKGSLLATGAGIASAPDLLIPDETTNPVARALNEFSKGLARAATARKNAILEESLALQPGEEVPTSTWQALTRPRALATLGGRFAGDIAQYATGAAGLRAAGAGLGMTRAAGTGRLADVLRAAGAVTSKHPALTRIATGAAASLPITAAQTVGDPEESVLPLLGMDEVNQNPLFRAGLNMGADMALGSLFEAPGAIMQARRAAKFAHLVPEGERLGQQVKHVRAAERLGEMDPLARRVAPGQFAETGVPGPSAPLRRLADVERESAQARRVADLEAEPSRFPREAEEAQASYRDAAEQNARVAEVAAERARLAAEAAAGRDAIRASLDEFHARAGQDMPPARRGQTHAEIRDEQIREGIEAREIEPPPARSPHYAAQRLLPLGEALGSPKTWKRAGRPAAAGIAALGASRLAGGASEDDGGIDRAGIDPATAALLAGLLGAGALRAGLKGVKPAASAAARARGVAERVLTPAIRVKNFRGQVVDEIWTGENHLDAAMKAVADMRDRGLPVTRAMLEQGYDREMLDGFLTTTGRFVNRVDAAGLEGMPHTTSLISEELKGTAAARAASATEPERVTGAATIITAMPQNVRGYVDIDEVFTGTSHIESGQRAARALGMSMEDAYAKGYLKDGFQTTRRRFISRAMAKDVAEGSGQITKGQWRDKELVSEMLDFGPKRPGAIRAAANQPVEIEPKPVLVPKAREDGQTDAEFWYTIVDAKGRKVADVMAVLGDDPDRGMTAYLEVIGDTKKANSLGPAATRDLLEQFRAFHPDVRFIDGLRTTGIAGRQIAETGGFDAARTIGLPLPKKGPRPARAMIPQESKAERFIPRLQELEEDQIEDLNMMVWDALRPDGEDLVAKAIGIPLTKTMVSPGRGHWGKHITPNTIISVARDTPVEKVRMLAAAQGIVQGQRAQVWLQMVPDGTEGASKGWIIHNPERPLTPADYRAMTEAIDAEPRFAPLDGSTYADGTAIFRNFTDTPDDEYARLLSEAADAAGLDAGVATRSFIGEYLDDAPAFVAAFEGDRGALERVLDLLRTKSSPVYRQVGESIGDAEVESRIQQWIREVEDAAGIRPREVIPEPGWSERGSVPLARARSIEPRVITPEDAPKKLTTPAGREALRRRGIPVSDRIETLYRLMRRERKPPIDEAATFDARVARGRKLGLRDVSRALKMDRVRDAIRWFKEDVRKLDDYAVSWQPELRDPDTLTLFHIVAALTSAGQNPTENLKMALGIMRRYHATGKLSLGRPFKTRKGGTALANRPGDVPGAKTQATIAGKLIDLQREIDDRGLRGALDYLLQPTLTEDGARHYPMVDLFGDKLGRYALNLNGIHDEATVDLWMVRQYRRWMGELRLARATKKAVEEGEEKGWILHDAPTIKEKTAIRAILSGVAETLSQQTGRQYDTSDIQALLWYYEKELFGDRLGSYAESFAEIERKYYDQQGLAAATVERSAASRGTRKVAEPLGGWDAPEYRGGAKGTEGRRWGADAGEFQPGRLKDWVIAGAGAAGAGAAAEALTDEEDEGGPTEAGLGGKLGVLSAALLGGAAARKALGTAAKVAPKATERVVVQTPRGLRTLERRLPPHVRPQGKVDAAGYSHQLKNWPAALRQKVRDEAEALIASGDLPQKRIVSHAETREAAKKLGMDDVMLADLNDQVDGTTLVAMSSVYQRNEATIARLAGELAESSSPTKFDEGRMVASASQLDHLLDQQRDLVAAFFPRASEAGRTLNALKIMAHRGLKPENEFQWHVRLRRIAGRDLLPEELLALRQALKHGDHAKMRQLSESLVKPIHWLSPEAILTLRKAGLLTGLRTQMRNLLSNTSEGVMRQGDAGGAAVLDWLASKFTGVRTTAFDPIGRVQASARGARRAFGRDGTFMQVMRGELGSDYLRKLDLPAETTIGGAPVRLSKALDGYQKFMFRVQGAADQPARQAAIVESLWEQARVMAKEQGIKDIDAFTKQSIDEALKQIDAVGRDGILSDMAMQAIVDAEEAVFQNRSVFGDIIGGARVWLKSRSQKPGTLGRGARIGQHVLDFVVPFSRTPGAVLSRVFERTPLGMLDGLMGLYELNRATKLGLDAATLRQMQRAAAKRFGRGATGTIAIALGALAASKGKASGRWPTDQAEAQKWMQEGKPEDAVFINGRWRKLTGVSPLGNLFAIGAQMYLDAKNGEQGALEKAVIDPAMTGLRTIKEQSFLKGTSDLLNAIDNKRGERERFVPTLSGSFVPTIVADWARFMDPTLRDTKGDAWAGVAARLPVISYSVPVKLDEFGRPKVLEQTLAERATRLADPFISQTPRGARDPLLGEMGRVGATMPRRNRASGEAPEAFRERQQAEGREMQEAMGDLFASKQYRNLSPEDKRQAVEFLVTSVRSQLSRARSAGRQPPEWKGSVSRAISKAKRED